MTLKKAEEEGEERRNQGQGRLRTVPKFVAPRDKKKKGVRLVEAQRERDIGGEYCTREKREREKGRKS